MKLFLLVLALSAGTDSSGTSPSSAAVSSSTESAASMPAASSGPSITVVLAEEAVKVLPPPPPTEKVPSLVEQAIQAFVDHQWAAALTPLLLLLAWALNRFLKKPDAVQPPTEKK